MKIYTTIFLVLLLTGCATLQKVPEAPKGETPGAVEKIKADKEIKPVAEIPGSDKKAAVKAEDHNLPEFRREAPQKPLPPVEPIDPKKVLHAEGNITLSVENMPLSDFIMYALGDFLKATFFIDEPVKNMKTPVTLRMAQEMPVEKVFEIVLGLLEKNELVVEEKGGALYITKTRVQKKPVDIRIGRDVPVSPAEILQIVPLKYLRPNEAADLIGSLYKGSVGIKPYHRENAFLLSGPAAGIKELMNLIEIFDVPYVEGKKAFILKLTYWQTEEFIKQMSPILENIGINVAKFPKDSGVAFIPIKVLNSILVLAPDDISTRYVLEWKERLDTAESAGTEEKAYTYNPKYSKASDLVDALRKLYTGAPAAPSAQTPAAPGQRSAPPQTAPTPALIIGNAKVGADDKRNVIMIHAAASEYKGILRYLESLDVPPKQVLIEATIAELTLKDDLKYGLEWYIKNRMNDGDYTLSTLGKLGLSTASGLAYQFISDTQKFQAAINAFAQENRINILSSPRLMVIDNQEATLQIGTDVPIISGETKSTSGDQLTTVTTQSVQYRSTGLILKVKPTINTEGMLALEISIESSEAQTNTLSSVSSPIVLTRRLNTIVIASTGQSILLGGIMTENLSGTETKVPLLGDIPLLGNLFKNTSKGKTKTELIVMIRPVIITSSEEAAALTNELKQSFKWLK